MTIQRGKRFRGSSPYEDVLRTGQLDSQKRRWESNPLEAALQAAAVPSGSSAKFSSALARSRAWSSTFAGSRANPPHSEDVFPFSALPRNRTSSGSFEDCHAHPAHPQGVRSSVSTRNRTWTWTFGGSYAIHYTIETFSVPTRSRTWARALGEPRAIRYTIGTNHQGRRLDLHQHDAVYKTAASLFGHVGFFYTCSANNRSATG